MIWHYYLCEEAIYRMGKIITSYSSDTVNIKNIKKIALDRAQDGGTGITSEVVGISSANSGGGRRSLLGNLHRAYLLPDRAARA